jgi:shikimate kinase
MIHLVGPGGSGKSTVGSALAGRLRVPFVDLDAQFRSRHGDISVYIENRDYSAYATRNVELYATAVSSWEPSAVVALSSGFMTYSADIHASYLGLRQRLASSPSTFVLLASLDFETCVAETVRRQLTRPFARAAAQEERVIRDRFSAYIALPAHKVATMRPVEAVVADLISALETPNG